MTGDEARDRFLDGLIARDASPHTRRAYATVVGAYLAWLDGRGIDWRRPGRAELRTYLALLGDGIGRTSIGQRLAALRSFYRFTTRNGWTDGDPWGAIATPGCPVACRGSSRSRRSSGCSRRSMDRLPVRPAAAT